MGVDGGFLGFHKSALLRIVVMILGRHWAGVMGPLSTPLAIGRPTCTCSLSVFLHTAYTVPSSSVIDAGAVLAVSTAQHSTACISCDGEASRANLDPFFPASRWRPACLWATANLIALDSRLSLPDPGPSRKVCVSRRTPRPIIAITLVPHHVLPSSPLTGSSRTHGPGTVRAPSTYYSMPCSCCPG